MSEKTWQNCRRRTCNRLVKASCILTRIYGLTTEYCGRKVNLYIEWVAKIRSYYVPNGILKFKIQETLQPLSIMHT